MDATQLYAVTQECHSAGLCGIRSFDSFWLLGFTNTLTYSISLIRNISQLGVLSQERAQ
jgi:hypothetical protein